MSTVIEPPVEQPEKNLEEVETVTIRFAGDSGDGMQLTGTQFTNTSAVVGNDISTLPDFPAEIRAPAGSLPGVSGFQLNFSSQDIKTPGDQPNVLVAMNPAALKVNLADLEEGGTLIINTDGFTPENLKYANYASNPLEDGSLAGYRVHKLPITTLNMNALKGNVELSRKEIDRCKNFFALGVLYWLYDRPMENTLELDHSQVWQESGAGEGKRDRAEDRLQLRRHDRSFHDALHDQESEDRSRQVSKDHRQRSDGDRVCGRVATCRAAAVLWFVSDHAGV